MLLFPRWIFINCFPNQINVNQTLQCSNQHLIGSLLSQRVLCTFVEFPSFLLFIQKNTCFNTKKFDGIKIPQFVSFDENVK